MMLNPSEQPQTFKTSNTSQQGFIYDALQLTMLDEVGPTCKMFKNELKTLLRALLHAQFSSQWFFSVMSF